MSLPIVDDDAAADAIDAAFRAGGADAPTPTRLLVNLGERCNLRCVHCITAAPEKTQSGRAQVMGNDVVDALVPALATVSYVALSHAGEPLLQPAFRPFLAALRAARGGAPTVVHLLSNGMALDEDRFVDVVALGVRSLAISLEGLTEQSNDAVRLGSRVSVLLPRLRRFVELRAAAGLDVRVGVSTVVTVHNLGELDALVDFVADAGLDWLKLEEVFAVDDVAGALVPDPRAVARAVAQARRRAEERAVVVVDHTRPRTVWRCLPPPSARDVAFAVADDRANRVEINSCRLPYEQACIEPDGSVRPVSFHHPIAGNVLREPLAVVWNHPAAVEVRAAQRATRPCGAGPTTCARDPGPLRW